MPTSLTYFVPSTRGYKPWRSDAVMGTIRSVNKSILRLFKAQVARCYSSFCLTSQCHESRLVLVFLLTVLASNLCLLVHFLHLHQHVMLKLLSEKTLKVGKLSLPQIPASSVVRKHLRSHELHFIHQTNIWHCV